MIDTDSPDYNIQSSHILQQLKLEDRAHCIVYKMYTLG